MCSKLDTFLKGNGVHTIMLGLERHMRNRIATFAIVQLLNALLVRRPRRLRWRPVEEGRTGDDPEDIQPVADLLLRAMRTHAGHGGVQRPLHPALDQCLNSQALDKDVVIKTVSMYTSKHVLDNCKLVLQQEEKAREAAASSSPLSDSLKRVRHAVDI